MQVLSVVSRAMAPKPTLWVWLSTLPDTKQGLSYRSDPDAALRYSKKTKVVLNAAAADLAAMKSLKLQGEWSEDDIAPNAVIALAKVQPEFVCHHLQHLSPSQKIQRQFWHSVGPGEETSIFFFKVLEVRALPRCVKLAEWACLQNHAFFSVLDDFSLNTLEEVWRQGVQQHGFQEPPIDVVRLPLCFAAMVANKTWGSFAVCDMSLSATKGKGGWHLGLRSDMRAGFEAIPWRIDPQELAEFSIQDPDSAEKFLDEIKDVIYNLQLGQAVDLERLHFYMTAFAGYTHELRGLIEFHRYGKRVQNQAFGLVYLIKCFLLSQSLRSASLLKTALHSAAAILLPKQASQIMQAALDTNSNSVPSASTISKARGRIDVSWMLLWRERIKAFLDEGAVVYLGTDSSPQGGRDYQIVVLDIVKKVDLAALHVSVMRLESLGCQVV